MIFDDDDSDDDCEPYYFAVLTVTSSSGWQGVWTYVVCSHLVEDLERRQAWIEDVVNAFTRANMIDPTTHEWNMAFEPYQNWLLN